MNPALRRNSSLQAAQPVQLAIHEITQRAGEVSAYEANQLWQQIEQLFDLPASRHLPYAVVDTYVYLRGELKRPLGQLNHQQCLLMLDQAFTAPSVVLLETARGSACPEYAV